MKLIFHYLRRHLGIFIVSILFLTLEAVADLMQPTFMSYIVDVGVAEADISRILSYGGIMLGIALAGAVAAILRNYCSTHTSQTIAKELRHDLYHKVNQLSLENIDRLQTASLITRITNDVTQIQEFVSSLMRMMVKAPLLCIGAIILIIIQTPHQAPVIIVVIAIVAVLIFGSVKIGYPRFGKVQRKLDGLNRASREFLSSVRVVKAFRGEEKESKKFEEAAGDLADANVSALRAMAIFSPLINLSINFGIVILLWISQSQNSSEIGRLMASVNYMSQVLFAVGMIANAINIAVRAVASSVRIQEVLEEEPAQVVAEQPLKPEIRGEISFDHASFAYAGAGKEALQDIHVHIRPGETIGIIGPTGSGKTTLINLVPRFYDVSSGSIRIDGVDVTKIEENWLRSAVAVVPQKALLFSGTIRDNLRWGKQDADDKELEKAAQIACADPFILETEQGYDTLLGQGGVNLSGGQKQRLALARALVRQPKILILDDCTSALDAETESQVLRGLREMEGETTVLLISQRISTVMRSDRILCLDNGTMQGFGTHKELMDSCRMYQEIYYSQIGGERHG